MAMSKCAAPEIEPVDIDVTDTVALHGKSNDF